MMNLRASAYEMNAKKTVLLVSSLLLIGILVFANRDRRTVRIKVQVKDQIVRVSFTEGELHSVKECQQMWAGAIASNHVQLVVADLPLNYPNKTDKDLDLVTKSLTGLILIQKIRYVYYYSEKERVSVGDISLVFVEVPYEEPMNLKEAKVFFDGVELGRGDEGMQKLMKKCREKPLRYVAAVLGLYTGKGSWPPPELRQALPEEYRSEIKNIVEQGGGGMIQMNYYPL